MVVRRLTHVPDCEGSIPTGYSYLNLYLILFLVYYNFDG